MDLKKLKIEKFNKIMTVNFPEGIDSISKLNYKGRNPEVIIYYIDKIEDVKDFVELCNNANLPEENRTVMVYKKGRKEWVNRDSIFLPFRTNVYKEFKLKAPMLCSISDELSACVFSKA